MFTPLKVTTDYSLLKSLIKIKDLINFCLAKNIKSCAICDTNLFGCIEFYKACKKNNIKPIIGLEITLNNYPLYLYAENYAGYQNLLKINSIITERNISILELQNLSLNILAIVPFKSMELFSLLSFFNHLYIGYENEVELKSCLIKSPNVVYVNDIKAFTSSSLKYLKYLGIINGENEGNYINNYFNMDNLKAFDFKKIEEVTNLLNIEIPKGNLYIPKYKDGEDSYNYLVNLCLKGLKKRCQGNVSKKYLDRLKYELSVIKKMGFVDYFLIVYDYVLYAKKHNILVGPGRGSAAGSLTSYVIGITDVDPIKYDLLFERFLNYERVSMPDIDIDFDNTKREEVINYVKDKYGHECVAGGLTFTTFKTRLVLRDVGKILEIEEKLLDKFIKTLDKDKSLKNNYELKEVKEYLSNYPKLKELYEISLKLEGLKKNISTHAAGIVIANRPLDEIIPMYKNKDIYLVGVPMEYLEDLGLLKMDFLALKNLSTISNIIQNIPNFNILNIPLDDKEVYDLFSSAQTDGIFQFETKAFKNMLVKYKPQNFSELVASIALVRPGPSKELETYIRRKNKQEKITYYHDSLKSILEETYGVIVYQEQVISILVKMAAFSYAEADNVRRAMAKKKMDLLNSYKEEFITKSVNNGYDLELCNNIFSHILHFASYGFNKAHSVSYALVSYEMAYLKVHYKPLFTFELLKNESSIEKIKIYLNELKQANYIIKGVNVNKSLKEDFYLENKDIYLPFNLIKNMPKEVINNIINERNNGMYTDVFSFFRRTISFMSKKDYRMLITSSALKDLGMNNKTLINNLDKLINYGNLYIDLKEDTLTPYIDIESEYDEKILREDEVNSYGFFISNHPASKIIDKNIMKLDKIRENVFKNVICYVMIENISNIKTKNGEDMAFISGSDETGMADFTVFPNNYFMLQNVVKNDMIKVWGNVTKRYDKYSIIVKKINKE